MKLTHLNFPFLLDDSGRVWKDEFHFDWFVVNLTGLVTLLS